MKLQQQCECKNQENQNIEYIGICQNEECQEDLFCEKCKVIHTDHEKDLIIGDEFTQLIQKYCSPKYQNKIEQEQQLIIQFQQFYENIDNDIIQQIKMLTTQGNFQEAIKQLDQIIKFKEHFDNNKIKFIKKKLDEQKIQLKIIDKNQEALEIKLLINKGRKQFNEQNYNDALQHLENALSMNYDCLEALLLKGQILIQLEDYDKSIKLCDQIIEKDNSNCEAYFIKIIALLLIQKYDIAINELVKVNLIASYKFQCNIINLINCLESNSDVFKSILTSLDFDLKDSLKSLLILNTEIQSDILQQYLRQIIEIIKIADEVEINKALFSYNLNFEIIKEYQHQYDINLVPILIDQQWDQVKQFLEFNRTQIPQDQNQQNSNQQQTQIMIKTSTNQVPDNSTQDQQSNKIIPKEQSQQIKFSETSLPIISMQLEGFYNSDENIQSLNQNIFKDDYKVFIKTIILLNFYNNQKLKQQVSQLINLTDIILDESKRQEEIINYCDQIISQNQQISYYFFKKAMCLIKKKQLLIALNILNGAIFINPKEANYSYQKALLLRQLGYFDKFLHNLDVAIQKNPDEALYYVEKGLRKKQFLGKALQKLNQIDEANQQFHLAKEKQK